MDGKENPHPKVGGICLGQTDYKFAGVLVFRIWVS